MGRVMLSQNRKLSSHLIKAQEILDAISGKALTVHERQKKAVDLAWAYTHRQLW